MRETADEERTPERDAYAVDRAVIDAATRRFGNNADAELIADQLARAAESEVIGRGPRTFASTNFTYANGDLAVVYPVHYGGVLYASDLGTTFSMMGNDGRSPDDFPEPIRCLCARFGVENTGAELRVRIVHVPADQSDAAYAVLRLLQAMTTIEAACDWWPPAAALAEVERLQRRLHYMEHEGWNCQTKLEHTVTAACADIGLPPEQHHRLPAEAERLRHEAQEVREALGLTRSPEMHADDAHDAVLARIALLAREVERLRAEAEDVRGALGFHPDTEIGDVLAFVERVRAEARVSADASAKAFGLAGDVERLARENATLRAERDAAVREASRRDQKWMDGIDSIVGRKLCYDPLGETHPMTLDRFIGELRAERNKLALFKKTTHALLDEAGAPQFEGEACRVGCRVRWLAERAREAERLRAGLPRTADGVYVTPDDEVWHPTLGRMRPERERNKDNFQVWVAVSIDVADEVPVESCYSTPEAAALAARPASEGGAA